MSATESRTRVLIVGGGVAGAEALLGLHRHLADRVAVTLLAPGPDFTYRPLAVGQPFSASHALHVPLARLAEDTGARLVAAAAEHVDLAARRVTTAVGHTLDYDALLVAVGARAVPGVEHATTWQPEGDPARYGGFLRDLEEGYARRVAFVVPAGAAWPLPIYELALMTAREAYAMGREVELTIVTPEREPLALFGPHAAGALLEELERADIRLCAGVVAEVHHGATTTVALGAGRLALEVDRVIAVPRLIGPGLGGLPTDADGFVVVDAAQQIEGSTSAWAAGDGTAEPTKYGGLATHQARRALTGIARLAGGSVPDEPLVPRLHGVLLLGGRGRGLGSAAGDVPVHAPLWTPAAKISGTYLPEYLRRLDPDAPAGATEEELAAADGVLVVDGLLARAAQPATA
jgi:sulfide:quinone oxidoreductase